MRKFRIFYRSADGKKRQRTFKLSKYECKAMQLNVINMSDMLAGYAKYVGIITKTEYFNIDYITEIKPNLNKIVTK